jgi:DNA polymerase-3 subunit epsilon
MTLIPIFYDTETTGTRPDKDRIIELAAYDPIHNRTFTRLINPGQPIPKEASAVHGISDEMVKDAPSYLEVGKEFIEFCQGPVVLIAHNNDAFDQPFLKFEFERHGIQMPDWRFFDTLKWSRRYNTHLPRHSLQFLREHFDIAANNAHRALDDVIVLHQVYTYMTDDLTIEQAIKLLNTPRQMQHMPFGKHQGKPLKEVPKDYIKWMEGTGAFDKPDNAELKQRFIELNLLAPV